MSFQNTARDIANIFEFNHEVPFGTSGTNALVPAVTNTTIAFGDGSTNLDLKFFGSSTSNYLLWDASANDLIFQDNVSVMFGTGNDIEVRWDGTDLDILQAAENSSITLGISGAGIDFVLHGDTTGVNATWDQSANSYIFNDNARMVFGTGSDVSVYWDATYLRAASPTGVWTNAIPSRLDPNFAANFYEIFDDFEVFDPTATVGKWVVIEDDAGLTQTLSDTVAGGVLVLTNVGNTEDHAQQITGVASTIRLAAGKHVWYEARVRTAAGATQIDVIAGLCQGNTVEDMTGVADNRFADGIGFFKSDGATTIQFGASKDGTDTGTNTDVGTLTTNWHTLAFYVNGLTSATPYVDGVADTAITATFCDDENLTPIFMVRNGDGVTAQTLEIDYVRVVQLR